nr:hypothetical protein [Tanacetum cinerariifolium]
QMQMVGGNGGNQFRQYIGNSAGYNDVIGNQIGNGNLVAARAEGNVARKNGNQIRCYNCRGVAGTDLATAAGTDLATAVGTDLATAAGTDLANHFGTRSRLFLWNPI